MIELKHKIFFVLWTWTSGTKVCVAVVNIRKANFFFGFYHIMDVDIRFTVLGYGCWHPIFF